MVFLICSLIMKTAFGYEPLTYDGKLLTKLPAFIWAEKYSVNHKNFGLPNKSGSVEHVKQIDDEYWDRFIVDQWNGRWKQKDYTWIIFLGWNRPQTDEDEYDYSLGAKSITVLCDNYYQDKPKVRFGLIDYNEWPELRETLYADERPTIVMLK